MVSGLGEARFAPHFKLPPVAALTNTHAILGVRRFRAMRLFWPLLILFQIWAASEIALPAFDAARGSYRHDERAAAFKAMDEHPSPETKAAMQRELHLNAEHILHQHLVQGGILLAVFVVLDVAGYYAWKNFRQSYGYNHQRIGKG